MHIEKQQEVADKSPMQALFACLATFFREYGTLDGLHGVLSFSNQTAEVEDDISFSAEFRRSPRHVESPWAELVVLDPTQTSEDLNLAPSLSPATQLLLVYEMQRAAMHLQEMQIKLEAKQQMPGKSENPLQAVFEPLPPLKNSLPAFNQDGPVTALLLQGNPSKGVGTLEVAIIDKIVARPGWNASFLHRFDTSSELHARLCDVNENSGACATRREGSVVLCPCHFVCMLEFQRDGAKLKLKEHDLQRFRTMRKMLDQMVSHQRALADATFGGLANPQSDVSPEKAAVIASSSKKSIKAKNKKKRA
jgi:hypothetical protein